MSAAWVNGAEVPQEEFFQALRDWENAGKRYSICSDGKILGAFVRRDDRDLAMAAPNLLVALRDMDTVTRVSPDVSDEELGDLEERYGESLTWSQIVDAVRTAARAAIAKASPSPLSMEKEK